MGAHAGADFGYMIEVRSRSTNPGHGPCIGLIRGKMLKFNSLHPLNESKVEDIHTGFLSSTWQTKCTNLAVITFRLDWERADKLKQIVRISEAGWVYRSVY